MKWKQSGDVDFQALARIIMWNRLKEFLHSLPGSASDGPANPHEEVQVAAAALLFHVIDADGIRSASERERLEELLAEEFVLSSDELKQLITAGEKAEREAIDLYAFTSILKRRLNSEERLAFVRLLWEIVYSDGDRSELEDNLVWRIAELIEVERADRIALRRSVELASRTD